MSLLIVLQDSDPYTNLINTPLDVSFGVLLLALVTLILYSSGITFIIDWVFEVLNLFPKTIKSISRTINKNTHGEVGAFIFYLVGVPGIVVLFLKIIIVQVITSFDGLSDILKIISDNM